MNHVYVSHSSCVFRTQFAKGLQETDANGSSRPRSRRQEPAGRHRPITTQDDHPDPPTLAPGDPIRPWMGWRSGDDVAVAPEENF